MNAAEPSSTTNSPDTHTLIVACTHPFAENCASFYFSGIQPPPHASPSEAPEAALLPAVLPGISIVTSPQDEEATRKIRQLAETASGQPEQVDPDRTITTLRNLADEIPSARFLLFYSSATSLIKEELRNSRPTDTCLTKWQSYASALLDFQRCYRDRSVLINAETASQHINSMTRVIRDLGHDCQITEPTDSNDDTPAGSLPGILADLLLRSRRDIRSFETELEARATPIITANQDTGHPVAEAIDEYLELRAHTKALSLENLQKMQEIESREARIGELEESISHITRQLEESEIARQGVVTERDLFLLQTQQAQEELDLLFEKNAEISRWLTEHSKETAHLKEKREADRKKIEEKTRTLDELNGQLEHARSNRKKAEALLSEQKALNNVLEQQFKALQLELDKERSLREDEQKRNALLALQHEQAIEELEHYSKEIQELTKARATEPGPDHNDTNPVGESGEKPSPASEIPASPASRRLLRKHAKFLEKSGQFDKEWYLNRYPDVAQSGMDPIWHYLRFGYLEGRNPSPLFDTRYYMTTYPDVAKASINPFVHYLKHGMNEGRTASM